MFIHEYYAHNTVSQQLERLAAESRTQAEAEVLARGTDWQVIVRVNTQAD